MIRRAPRADTGFQMLAHSVSQDERLKPNALGILVRILSYPDDWRTDHESLARSFGIGTTAVRTALKQLREVGYVEQTRHRNERGQWITETVIHDRPQGASASQPESQSPHAPAAVALASSPTGTRFAKRAQPNPDTSTFSQVGTSEGFPHSGNPHSAGPHLYKDFEHKEPVVECPTLPSSARGRQGFVDWRPEDRELFRRFVGDELDSDGTDFPEGSYPADYWYELLQKQRKPKIEWPGKFMAKLDETTGVEHWLAARGLESVA